jgi:hypothetical protein
MALADQDDTVLKLILEGAVSALNTESAHADQREVLTQIVVDALSAMRNYGLSAALLAREGSLSLSDLQSLEAGTEPDNLHSAPSTDSAAGKQ